MGAPGGCRAVAVEPLRLEPRSCAGRIRVEPAARPRTRLWLARQSESRGPITGRRACWRHVTRVCGAVPDCRRPAGRQRPARQCRHHSSAGTIAGGRPVHVQAEARHVLVSRALDTPDPRELQRLSPCTGTRQTRDSPSAPLRRGGAGGSVSRTQQQRRPARQSRAEAAARHSRRFTSTRLARPRRHGEPAAHGPPACRDPRVALFQRRPVRAIRPPCDRPARPALRVSPCSTVQGGQRVSPCSASQPRL